MDKCRCGNDGTAFLCIGGTIIVITELISKRNYCTAVGHTGFLFITLSLANIGFGYLNYHLTGVQVDMFHNSYGNPFLMLLSACTGIAAVVLLSYRLNVRWIAYVGKNSMIYFVAHQRFYAVVDPYVLRILGIHIKNALLLQWINAVVMVIASILLFSLINAVLSHIPAMAFMFGIKPNRSSK